MKTKETYRQIGRSLRNGSRTTVFINCGYGIMDLMQEKTIMPIPYHTDYEDTKYNVNK